jgi:hypothetical protein
MGMVVVQPPRCRALGVAAARIRTAVLIWSAQRSIPATHAPRTRGQIRGWWWKSSRDSPTYNITTSDLNSLVEEFVAGYGAATTPAAYRSDLSLWSAHCRCRQLQLLEVRRVLG